MLVIAMPRGRTCAYLWWRRCLVPMRLGSAVRSGLRWRCAAILAGSARFQQPARPQMPLGAKKQLPDKQVQALLT